MVYPLVTIFAMSAPGNSALIVVMLAVFVACCAYAAGRLHQRFQMKTDREEAYRDGYDTATRSVFSLAARIIAPRRAIRGSAAVKPTVDGTVVPEPVSPAPAVELPVAAQPPPPPSPPRADDAGLGFPAPPPPPAKVVAEPAAVGGVVYRPFPDPRPAGGSEPLMGDPSSMPAPRRRSTTTDAASTGRHTVPDELVQAATYRLPADRVFRAKVPEPADRPALPEEPTTRIWVPKPRQS